MTKVIWANKLKFFISLILLIAAITVAFFSRDNSQAQEEKKEEKKVVMVKTQKVQDSRNLAREIKYPATISGDQEIKLISQISGVATNVNFDLGDIVSPGKLLVRLDDQGASNAGESGFKSSQIQQLEMAVKQAEESLDLAKDNYKENKSDATKSAKDLAKIQLESAKINLDNAINAHLITAPISGTIVSRQVTTGDTVSPGQLLAIISKTNKVKAQFYVAQEELKNFSVGLPVVISSGSKEISARIINVAPQADETTRRFLVEASPESSDNLIPGTILSVLVSTRYSSLSGSFLLLPLSAISITQNESYIFILKDDLAQKVPVEIVKVNGEIAEIKADISLEEEIIVEGNKLIQDGEAVTIQ